jgi:hypothetical protein
MRHPPLRAPRIDPGDVQARADGQLIEVRTYEGQLIRRVPGVVAQTLVDTKIADTMKHGLRLRLGVRWLPPRFDRPSGRPDLEQMRRRDPRRYQDLWKGSKDAHAGKGALGKALVDGTVHLPLKAAEQ